MFRYPSRFLRGPFGVGLGAGGLIGGGVLIGVLLTFGLNPWSLSKSSLAKFSLSNFSLAETSLEAVASSGGESMAIATGLIGDGVEGLLVLDFVTSQLTCQVLNPRTGQLAFMYHRNVAQDLGVQQGKQPKYLLVTGELKVRQNVGNVRPAESMVYVADVNTGRYVAYVMPFSKQAMDFNQQVVTQMIPIGGGSARNIVVE